MTPGQEAAQQRIHELLAELTEVIGPNYDGEGGYEPGEEPTGASVLSEYVVAAIWVDGDDDDFVTVLSSAGMKNHHTIGLLRVALADADSP